MRDRIKQLELEAAAPASPTTPASPAKPLRHSELTLVRKWSVLTDVARGLVFLHSQTPPVVHRDLKSGNVFVTQSWQGKLGDFGLARTQKHTIGQFSLVNMVCDFLCRPVYGAQNRRHNEFQGARAERRRDCRLRWREGRRVRVRRRDDRHAHWCVIVCCFSFVLASLYWCSSCEHPIVRRSIPVERMQRRHADPALCGYQQAEAATAPARFGRKSKHTCILKLSCIFLFRRFVLLSVAALRSTPKSGPRQRKCSRFASNSRMRPKKKKPVCFNWFVWRPLTIMCRSARSRGC